MQGRRYGLSLVKIRLIREPTNDGIPRRLGNECAWEKIWMWRLVLRTGTNVPGINETDILFVLLITLLRQLGSICQSTNFCFGITELLAAADHGPRAEA